MNQKSKRYQNSVCRGNWLHKFVPIKMTQTGSLERCERCGMTKHFLHKAPSHTFVSYNIRSLLTTADPLFYREYPQIKE